MDLIDFDGLFDEKLAIYMEKNSGKYTEAEWEDIIPKLYAEFGDTYVSKIKCTPKEYYKNMSDAQLTDTLKAHLSQDVAVPEFLCDEIESRNMTEQLMELLNDESTALYAMNLIGNDKRAYDTYFKIVSDGTFNCEIRSEALDYLKTDAVLYKERALGLLQDENVQDDMLELLSNVKEKDERIFTALCDAFETRFKPIYASYFANYKDERALKILLKKIEDDRIGFVEFQELKYAIEALGGEYTKERDFSDDKDFLAVEIASEKELSFDKKSN